MFETCGVYDRPSLLVTPCLAPEMFGKLHRARGGKMNVPIPMKDIITLVRSVCVDAPRQRAYFGSRLGFQTDHSRRQ